MMSAKEQVQISELYNKIEEGEKRNIKLYYKVKEIISLLEDDPRSNSKGLISKVNDLDEQVEKLLVMNSAIKKASVILFTILGSIATYAAKLLFFD